MTHLPDLERELDAAAHRRFARPAACRPSRVSAWLRPRLLVAVAAALLALVVGTALLRGQDPEVEAPAGPPAAVGTPSATLDELVKGPLGGELGSGGAIPADPRVAPVSLNVRAEGDEWIAAAYAGPGGTACFVATLADSRERNAVGGTNCVAAGILGLQVHDRGASFAQPSESRPPQRGSRIVYGVVGADAESARVTLGGATRPATIAPGVLEIALDETQRGMGSDGRPGSPDLRTARLRLFAAAFTELEVPAPLQTLALTAEVTYADGETATHRRSSQLDEG